MPRIGGTLYSIGDPTGEEQLYLENINRARANPPAEGLRLANTTDPDVLDAYASFGVDLNLMVSQFNAIAAAPPVSMNAKLLAAARLHSGDMFTNMFQGHTNFIDGKNFDTRITAQGYSFSTAGENVFSYSKSVFYGHAGFEVDWGTGTGGMQTPPGHRINIHNSAFREVGVGVVDGTNGSVGPQLVTQDFATASSATPFITGVAYYDFNTNGFYDVGEGLPGVTVAVTNSSFYAVTTNSGGYSVPVAGNGTYTVTFSGSGLVQAQRTVTVSGGNNVKVDFVPVYMPPAISGPNSPTVGISNAYTFTPVGAATGYQWKQTRINPFTAIEGAESGLTTNVTASTSAGYSVIATDVSASGIASFHLAHPSPATDQFLTLNRSLLANGNSQLIFSSRLGWAAVDQTARVQISVDNGVSWQDLWSQAGTDNSGEQSFTPRTISLAAYAGQEFRIRFVYAFSSGGFFPQTSTGVGWYIDDISFSSVDELIAPIVTPTTSTSFDFVPGSTGNYLLQVAAQLSGRILNYGPAKTVSAVAAPAVVRLSGTRLVAGNQIQIDLQVVSGAPAGFQVESALEVAGSWGADASASIQTILAGSQYRITASMGSGPTRYYRVRILP